MWCDYGSSSICTVSPKASMRVCMYFGNMLGHLMRTEVKWMFVHLQT